MTNTEPMADVVERLKKALPLLEDLKTGQDCEDYAFATGKGFQAMTYCPEAFEALRAIPDAINALSQPTPSEAGRLNDDWFPLGVDNPQAWGPWVKHDGGDRPSHIRVDLGGEGPSDPAIYVKANGHGIGRNYSPDWPEIRWYRLPRTHEFYCNGGHRPSEASGDVVEAVRHLLDRDRYIVAIALGHIKKALNSHRWLLEGRGPYEWDDDRYRDEFAAWVQDVEAATGLLAKLAWDKEGCEIEADKVSAAREAARVYAVDPPIGHRTMLPSDLGLPCPSCAALTQAPQADAWRPIETAPKDWVPVLVWAVSEDEWEDAEDEGRPPQYSAMVARHSIIQPGQWWLCASSMVNAKNPTHWQPLSPPRLTESPTDAD